VRLWKRELQNFADETGLLIHVHHYPPGTSKWNKIEHRLFCPITQNWRGRPLIDRLAVVELIAATTTKTGLKVECALDTRTYKKGIKVSKAEMAHLNITGDAFHPQWNYTITPRQQPTIIVALIVRAVLSSPAGRRPWRVLWAGSGHRSTPVTDLYACVVMSHSRRSGALNRRRV
jgi:hypothetical protein